MKKEDKRTFMGTASFDSGRGNTMKIKFPKIEQKQILKGFWLDENDQELKQSDGLNKEIFYGQTVKIKIVTEDTSDGEIIEVEIKATKGGEYIDLDDEQETLKLILKVKNNEAISEPFYLNLKWYNEEKENYNYDTHQTEIEPSELLTFVFDAKYEGQEKKHGIIDLPKDDTLKLKPVTYRRNYEELIGLFNTDDSGTKDKENNYENKFINYNSEIKTIVDEFIEKVTDRDITISEIKTLVEEKAKALWVSAVKQVQSGNLDDRPLYWARNKMQTWLKRNQLFKDQIDFEKSLVKKGTKLDSIITLFEEKSRNYTGIDFSKAVNKKKVLITGFDPFQLDYKFYGNKGVQTFNPSGIIALALQNNKELLKNDIYIQTCIFPVRYEDFDNQVVENVVKRNINQLSLLITTSLNGSNPRFDIEKYAIEYRGEFHDNMCIGDYDNPKFDKSRFLANKSSKLTETTLPKEKIFGASDIIELNGQSVYFDTEKSKTTGSGNNYLSNEVMYRATKVRGNLKVPVGHFHLGNLGDINNTVDTVEIIFAIIKRILL